MTALPAQVLSDDQLSKLLELLKELKFGSVTLIVQDGKVVQIDKTEKLRFGK
ncbi:MAG: YezD family protein [Oscillospiraceae bacterium]|jgi:hypothetical protein|nr:YezD family protein [Oscillospiraceae bacterium]